MALETRRSWKLGNALWLPTAVVGLGWLLAFGVSGHLASERRERIERSTASIAAESRKALADLLARQRSAARDRAVRWARFSPASPSEWESDAQQLIQNVPGFAWVAWLPLHGRMRLARAEGAGEVALDPDEARARRESVVVGPAPRPGGGFELRIYEPAPAGAGPAGVLVAGIDVERLLAGFLAQSAPGHAITITWGEPPAVIASRGEPVGDPELAWWRAEGEVSLGPGAVWRVVHAPTERLASALLTPLPDLLRVLGVLLSLAAGVIVLQLQLAQRAARELDAANRALEARMREARSAEDSLRHLSDELERRVRSRTRQLEDTMSELETLNFTVSHDLRSPIGAVLNFVAILEEEHRAQLDAAGREILARIRASAERAIQLLEGLLKLSRAGRAELTFEALDMTALARDAWAQARAPGQDADVELAVGVLPPARGDHALVGTVLVNLLGNALKYTRGREKRRIEVSGAPGERENVYAVSDNGVGFDGRFASKLFGAFERLHPPGAYEGTGIGLAVVARIVMRHGGRVWAEGSPEKGATFYFSLPNEPQEPR